MSAFDYETLYTASVAAVDDRDYVTEQSITGLTLVTASNLAEFARSPMTVEFLGEWLSAAGAVILTTRGTYSLSLIKRIDKPVVATGQSLIDSVTETLIPGGRPVLVDDLLGGDEFGVRITDMVPPALGTQLRITFRAMPETN